MESKNKIIAEFMGYRYETGVSLSGSWSRYFKNGGTFEDSFPEAKYDTSWDWLMPVWKKILQWGTSEFGYRWVQEITQDAIQIKCVKCKDSENPKIIIGTFQGTLQIEDVYTAVTEFIEWYNKEKDGK